MTDLVLLALEIARGQVGVREMRRNRGPEVDEYVRSVGLDPVGAHPWCAAFAYWCYRHAADTLGVSCPLPRTGSVLKMAARAPVWARSTQPSVGALGVHDAGGGHGHLFFVRDVVWPEKRILTIEGNSNDAGEREGVAVVLGSRPFEFCNGGYLDFSRAGLEHHGAGVPE